MKKFPNHYLMTYQPIPWVRSMANWGELPGPYRLSKSQPHCTLLNSCFAALGLETMDGLKTFSLDQRKLWAQYILNHQGEDGHFVDPLLGSGDLQSHGHNLEYLIWQFTYFSLAALDAFSEKPLHPLKFLDEFLESNDINIWLDHRNWSDPWLESNNIMFRISLLLREWERTGENQYHEAVTTILDWLDTHQNPQTGFWDLDQGASLLNAMAGAFHFFFLYFYTGRKVQHPERIIDSTLSLQQPDGLFEPDGGGGACLDLDAVDILVKFGMVTDYRSEDVKTVLTRAFNGILLNQNPDGGFCEAKRPSLWQKSFKRKAIEWMRLDKLIHHTWQGRPVEYLSYSGWSKMCYRVDESDLWSTWFRTLTLALISKRYPGEFIESINWQFRDSPMLGWHNIEKIQQVRQRFYS